MKIDVEYAEVLDLKLCHSDKHIAAVASCGVDKKKGEPL